MFISNELPLYKKEMFKNHINFKYQKQAYNSALKDLQKEAQTITLPR
jgi:hypothetical protein